MSELEEALARLKARYLQGVAERLAEMGRTVDRLAADPADSGAARGLLRHFHGLAGSGGTYGLPRVSEIGRDGEALCRGLLDGGIRAEGIVRCRELFERLHGELAEVPAAAPAADGAAAGMRPTAKPFDILIVAAAPGTAALLARLVEREPMSIRTATSIATAEAELSRAMPDGVLVAGTLPDGELPRLVERLRALPGGDAPAALVVSDRRGFGDRVNAVHAGADGFFETPLDSDALLHRLQFLLERTRVEALRVLSVEDDPAQAAHVRAVLESAGYEVRICEDPTRFPADLAAFRPDLVLMDVLLPGASGYDLVRLVRQEEAWATLPVLFLTTEGELAARIEGARAGGDEHLVKPIPSPLLLTTVAARLEHARFLKSLVERDGLTRLLTHTAFFERLRVAIARRGRGALASAALVMIDIDHFKAINDLYGHPTGDRVLVALSRLLRRRLRQSETLGRLGGEEFGVLLEGLTRDEGLALVRRLLAEFSSIEHAAPDGSPFRVTFSAGVAMLAPTMDLRQWHEAADAALYAAKHAGRNRVESAPAGNVGDPGGGK